MRYRLATASMGLEDWEAARRHLRVLLEHAPGHERGWLAMGIVQARLRQWADAESALRRALVLDPGSERARTWLQRVRERAAE